jgi:hypothetical protein
MIHDIKGIQLCLLLRRLRRATRRPVNKADDPGYIVNNDVRLATLIVETAMCRLEEALRLSDGHDPPASPLFPSRGRADLSSHINESRAPGKANNGHSVNSCAATHHESRIVPPWRIRAQAKSGHRNQQASQASRPTRLGDSRGTDTAHFKPTVLRLIYDLFHDSFLILPPLEAVTES